MIDGVLKGRFRGPTKHAKEREILLTRGKEMPEIIRSAWTN